ncbi:MAG: hypothetical protein BWX81_01980 [Spirochaetes bacterium ADurb.Bin110]|nr:MAG: hypothetical protein BWX81_01980 [Spirochaetes bacterium ADurb.Bin110]
MIFRRGIKGKELPERFATAEYFIKHPVNPDQYAKLHIYLQHK